MYVCIYVCVCVCVCVCIYIYIYILYILAQFKGVFEITIGRKIRYDDWVLFIAISFNDGHIKMANNQW